MELAVVTELAREYCTSEEREKTFRDAEDLNRSKAEEKCEKPKRVGGMCLFIDEASGKCYKITYGCTGIYVCLEKA